ncbi:amino acid ABC transporter permease [Rhizobium sp. WW_1]|jgi:polar amino acid transport system permease protein|uniref:amino acid ABC transporter permease n=1 Tax=Rhizobium sp. WW_1 TaxID=1907375 RepID=UPI000647CCAC|nr:amino acid ABC transporter permease [Rhizobium sp. WW_1]RKD60807.1 amino acid ABC transporter membrane protein 2 (PAAT family) [Rhizobium sp. WW_1]
MPTFGLTQFIFLLEAALWTLALSALGFIGGGLVGFVVALARISPSRIIRWTATAYVQLIQGTPLLVLLFIVYFGLSIAGFNNLPALLSAGVAITLYTSAFLADIWRGAIRSIAKTQWEAAECLGLSRWQRMTRVILPQSLRIATPPTVGFLVQVIKNTSLASAIGFVELAQAGKLINNSTFQPFSIFMVVAAIYFVICFPLTLASRKLERKLNVSNR